MRPFMAIEAFRWAGGTGQKIFPPACALELIHTYSLIHDDLPAMDNDNFRRGKPTCHKVFGEGMAILAGDALHALAFELLAKTKNMRVIAEVAAAIGTQGLVGGQVVDIEMAGKDVDLPTVEYIHNHKTTALFVTSVRLGAILAGAHPNELASITRYAQNLGLAFQIIDDILDIKGEQTKLGKDIGSDLQQDKATYPKVIGIAKSQTLAQKLIVDAKLALLPGHSNECFVSLADFFIERVY